MPTDQAMKEARTIIAEHHASGRGIDIIIAEALDAAYARGRADAFRDARNQLDQFDEGLTVPSVIRAIDALAAQVGEGRGR